MKLIIVLLIGLLLLTNAQYHRGPQRTVHPVDNHNVGMRYQSPPMDEGDQFVAGIAAYFLESMKDVHIDEIETEDGTFRNVNIHVRPPPPNTIYFKSDENAGTIEFSIKNVGVDVDTDMDMYYGALKGHTKLQIKGIDMDVKTKADTEKGEEVVKAKYHLHIKDADVEADVTAYGDMSQLPEEVGLDFMPLFGNLETTFKIATTNMVDQAFEAKTQDLIAEYLDQMSTEYNISKDLGHKVKSNMKFSFDALPYRVGEGGSIIVDFDTNASTVKTTNSRNPLFNKAIKAAKYENNDLVNVKSELTNPNKHHVFISPQLIQGIVHNLDPEAVSFKLGDQKKLQKTVRDYFGDDIELECYNHEGEYPEYKAEGDAIKGVQSVKCVLHPKGQKFDALYEIDLQLDYNLHPKVDDDGKSLKAEFGKIEATSISHHDKKMEIHTTISDEMDDNSFMQQMDPFGSELIIPFLMNAQLNAMRGQEVHDHNTAKFGQMIGKQGIIDIQQLENSLFGNLKLPLPMPAGRKLTNTEVKILENGVIDVSGDLIAE